MKPFIKAAFGVVLLILIWSCQNWSDNQIRTSNISLSRSNDPKVITSAISDLGRVLFYDPALSLNGQISCGSCHIQRFGFADGKKQSVGFKGDKTSRNSPHIVNLQESFGFGFGEPLFWDGRANSVFELATMPILHAEEMGMGSIEQLLTRLESLPYYSKYIQAAFGESRLNKDKLSLAISQFLIGIKSSQSKFDQFLELSRFNNINEETYFSKLEFDGKNAFFNIYNCGSCHQMFSPNGYFDTGSDSSGAPSRLKNIGLDANPIDRGFGAVSNKTADNGKFKIPNLRNVSVTGPYMHDGRFTTLEEVIDFYAHGIQTNSNLAIELRDQSGNARPMQITAYDKRAIIAFLHTLTDRDFLQKADFSNPFQYAQ